MFSIAYVILPFSDAAPADAIRASLAPFQQGGRGDDIPQDWLAFHDETEWLRTIHETRFTFTDQGKYGLRVEGGAGGLWGISVEHIVDEMRRRGVESWQVRFADMMELDAFFDLYNCRMERGPVPGTYGIWRNPLGRWDWWDLGGRFDGYIIGEERSGPARPASQVSSGGSVGRSILNNLEDAVEAALGHAPISTIDVRSDRNIELAATLLASLKIHQEPAIPGAVVLPPGSVETRLRWLDNWNERAPREVFTWLKVAPDADWRRVVEASYARFQEHWVAGVAYHH